MKLFIGGLIGLVLGVSVGAEPLLEGRVRLSSGQPAAGVQVRLFDLADLRRFVGTTTDETGHFALPLQALSGGKARLAGFALGPNYPNPFNPSTIIPYQLSVAGHVRLEVFNLLGQRLTTLVDVQRPAGAHTAQWDGTDAAGRAVGAGVYIYRLSSEGASVSRRMVLVDGQAGISAVGAANQGSMRSAVEGSVEADGTVYGLTVSGQGLVPYVDTAFRVEADAASIVVETYDGTPRMKLAASGILGDVNNDGQVNLFDALYVMLYIGDSSITLPTNFDISLGDVNGDDTVDFADALILIQYSEDPSNPALPPGIGEGDDHGDTLSEATQVALGSSTVGSLLSDSDIDYFRVTMSSSGTLVAYTTDSADTYGSILDSSGSVLAEDDDGGESSNFLVFTPVSSGTYYIAVRGYGSSSTGNYTLHVDGGAPDLVVELPAVSDSTLAFGQPFTLQVTVRNQGFGPVSAITLDYYRSTDATISSSDTEVDGDESLLFASEAISLLAPEDEGTYYYGACVKSVGGESNTNNNCSDGVRVTVSQGRQMYWISSDRVGRYRPYERKRYGNQIQRANLDGGNQQVLVTELESSIKNLALDMARGKMYWTERQAQGLSTIQRARLDGSNVEVFITLGTREENNPHSLVLDEAERWMYWAVFSENRVWRARLDGSNPEVLVTLDQEGYSPVLGVAGRWIYWADLGRSRAPDTSTIWRTHLDEGNHERLVTVNTATNRLVLDEAGGWMYWADRDGFVAEIRRARLDGSNPEVFTRGGQIIRSLALDVARGQMYGVLLGGSYDSISRIRLDGSNPEVLVTEVHYPHSLVLDEAERWMYWINLDQDRVTRSWTKSIRRARLDGSNSEVLFSGLHYPYNLVLETTEPESP